MASFGAVLRIVLQRSLGNRRLLATVVTGVVLAAALTASVVLYSDAIRDLGLRYTLRNAEPRSLDLAVTSSTQPLRLTEYALRRERTDALLRQYAGAILDGTVRHGRSATFFLTAPGGRPTEAPDRPRANFQFADALADHVRVVEGRSPGAPVPARANAGPSLEVWVAKAAADQLGVRVGDRFDLHPYWRPEKAPVQITVAGLIEPNDPAEPYWFGRDDRFVVTSTSWPTYLFFTDEKALVEVVAAYLPDIDANLETYGFVDLGRIDSRNARQVESDLRTLGNGLRESIERTSLETELPATIQAYREKLFFTRLPLFALILQVVGIVLYYLVMVSTMVVERQAGEIALLKSRGASTLQIMGVYAIEGLALCLVAVLLGPLLAAAGIALLGPTPPFRALSEGGLLEVRLSAGAFGLALLGALMALAALLWPAYRAAAYSIVHYKQHLARPPQQPVFLRYYLDLVLIGVGAFLFYQLRQRGSLVTERLFGELSADPLLLVTPALFTLMIALVFLRLFPLALKLAGWAAHRLDGATVPLGLWRMVRSPVHYSRLILLLILATSVGMFAAGFRATLERSYDDRAAYQAGAAGRIEGIRTPASLPNPTLVAAVRRATGAGEVSPAARLSASYSAGRFQTADVTMLGVEPEGFSRLAFWRDDFGARSLAGLLAKIEPAAAGGDAEVIEVPAGSRFIGAWAQISTPAAGLGIRLQDPNGAYSEYLMQPAGAPLEDGWTFFTADLSRPAANLARLGPNASVPPLGVPRQLDAVYLRLGAGNQQTAERGSALLDDLQVTAESAPTPEWRLRGFEQGTVIEPFEDVGRYELVTGAQANADPGSLSRVEARGRPGEYAARIGFTRGRGGAPLAGIRPRRPLEALAVLASRSFLDAAEKEVGDEVVLYVNRQYVTARIAGDFALFPTYDPSKPVHFMVADLAALQAAASRVPSLADGAYANEAWLGALGDLPLTREELAANGVTAERVYDRAALRAEQGSDPLVAASWEGILFLSFAAVLLLTALGFLVYSYLTAQTRTLEFAILRTMGYSGRQILALVSFEQCFVIIAGVVAGTLLGLPLGRLMIGYMGLTERGVEVLPPLVSRVSWPAVLITYMLLAIMFVSTIIALVLLYSRLAVSRALRMGEL